MADTILALNAGSSSLKFALFDADGATRRLTGKLAEIDSGDPGFSTDDGADETWHGTDRDGLIDRLLAWIEDRIDGRLIAVGHRVVHGGRDFSEPVRVDAATLDRIEALTPLAPLHQPASVRPMRQIAESRPHVPQVACFDTAFHHGLQPPASRYPLPRRLEEEGIRRFGFHGLSYEAIARRLRAMDDGAERQKVIVAHLGNGASLCAMADLRSIDTSMGFTALDGVMMGTRPGALDPGILLYLIQQKGYDADRLETLLYHESGLLGVSGLSSDVAELAASSDPAAREALDLFAYRVAQEAAALATSAGGLDRLVFTGGIGEHSPIVRRLVAERLRWLGVVIDGDANEAAKTTISTEASAILVHVIATDEEGVIADHTRRLCGAAAAEA